MAYLKQAASRSAGEIGRLMLVSCFWISFLMRSSMWSNVCAVIRKYRRCPSGSRRRSGMREWNSPCSSRHASTGRTQSLLACSSRSRLRRRRSLSILICCRMADWSMSEKGSMMLHPIPSSQGCGVIRKGKKNS